MTRLIFFSMLLSLHLTANSQGSLTAKDYIDLPVSFSTKMELILAQFGPVRSVQQEEAFGGKGPIIRGDSILPGDTIYTTHLRIFTCDSIAFAFNDNDKLEYYFFTASGLRTFRGIGIGATKNDLLRAYPQPNDDDWVRHFDDLRPDEDEVLQYADSESVNGIAFFFSKGKVKRIYVGRGAGC
jgi:hypothetical protein